MQSLTLALFLISSSTYHSHKPKTFSSDPSILTIVIEGLTLKIIALVMVSLVLAAGFVSATEDSEILQFAKGVLAGSYSTEQGAASINGQDLVIVGRLDQYSDLKVSTISYRLMDLARAAETIITAYPDRFAQVNLSIYDSTGKVVIGQMRISANASELDNRALRPF